MKKTRKGDKILLGMVITIMIISALSLALNLNSIQKAYAQSAGDKISFSGCSIL